MSIATRWRPQTLVALLAIIVAALAASAAPASAADTITRSEFCDAWSAAKSGEDSLILSTGVKVEAERLIADGPSCDSPDAAIRTVDPKLSDAPEGAAGIGAVQALASVVHAAGGTQLQNGSEVFKGAYIAGFTYWIGWDLKQYINGRLIIDFSQTTTELSFAGTFSDIDHYSINVFTPQGAQTRLPGVGGDPLSFTGTFVRNGATSNKLNISASAPFATLGEGEQQLSLTGGKLALSLADETTGTGLKLAASGQLGIGSAVKVDGAISADFDETGLKSFTGGGGLSVTVPAKGNTPGGSVSGSAELKYTREPLQRSITFSGGITVGDAVLANATGTIDDVSVSFTGAAQLSGADLSIKGGVDGIVYFGDDLTGRTIQNHAGAQVPAQKGDVLLKAATGEVTWKALTLKGGVQFGDVGSEVWAKADGSIALTFQQGDQPPTTITGGAGLDWLKGSSPAVTFSGSIASGSTEVLGATGTIDAAKISFTGQATLANPDLTIKGAVSGVVFYGSDLTGETVENPSGASVQATKGDFALTAATASIETRGLGLSGGVTLGRVGGQRWATGGGAVDLTYGATNLKGSAELSWISGELPGLTFSGEITSGANKVSAKGTIDGKKLLFEGSIASPTLNGTAKGGVYYGSNLAGESIVDKSGKAVTPKAGDFYLSGSGNAKLKQVEASASFTVKSVSGVWWVSTNAQIKVAKTFLAFTGDIDGAGNFSLKGSGSVDFDGTTVQFSGVASVTNGKLVIAGSGTVKTGLFSATIAGTIEKADAASSTYVLTGTASFKFGTIQVSGATVRLTLGEGLTATFGIKACFLFICPNATYKLYFRGGSPYKAELNAPIAWALQFLGIGAVVLGPSVPISTTITGII